METLSVVELKNHLDQHTPLTLIDLQSDEGYEHRHIPGAVHLPSDHITEQACMNVVKDKDAVIVVYGEFDELGKGSAAVEALRACGYTHVQRLAGGLMGWMEAGYHVEGGKES